jgi:c-di-GMP-binding flagellar brake protein YcgR
MRTPASPQASQARTLAAGGGAEHAGDFDHSLPNRLGPRPEGSENQDMAVVDAEDVTPGSARVYQRRRHARVTVNGSVRLVADTSSGIVTLKGTIIDLSVSGCAIRIYGRLEPNKEARLELQVGGDRVWVPGQVVWTRTRDRAWTVGIRFERLVPEKQSLITRLVAERSRHANAG